MSKHHSSILSHGEYFDRGEGEVGNSGKRARRSHLKPWQCTSEMRVFQPLLEPVTLLPTHRPRGLAQNPQRVVSLAVKWHPHGSSSKRFPVPAFESYCNPWQIVPAFNVGDR